MRRLPLLALTLVVATAACLDETPVDLDPQFASAASTAEAGGAVYRVSVTNLSGGQPFTPPLAAVHRRALDLFEVGGSASFELQQIAENGDLGPMLAFLDGQPHATDVVVTFGATLPPVLPGETVEFTIEGMTGAKYLSIVSMLICTNDGFTGVDGIRLPKRVGESLTRAAAGYDAGTEVNTESFEDLVPPCGPLTGFDSMGAGTGATNPALAEGGVVRMHPGIAGEADLDAAAHGWTDPVARITVERIG